MKAEDIRIGMIYLYREPHQKDFEVIRITGKDTYFKGRTAKCKTPYNYFQSQYIKEAGISDIKAYLIEEFEK